MDAQGQTSRHRCDVPDILQIRSCVKKATELYDEYDTDDLVPLEQSTQGMVKLMEAAGTSQVGCDGRLKKVREDRRFRVAMKSGQLTLQGSRMDEIRFLKLDEDHVACRLLDLQSWSLEDTSFPNIES